MVDDNPGSQGPTVEDLRVLNAQVEKANKGDLAALQWLRRFLDERPEVWRHIGDLARTAERAWLALIANGDVLASEAIRRQLDDIRLNLVGESPSPIEKMLGDQVVATLLEVKFLESRSAEMQGAPLTQASLLLKRLESSQRRHLAAIRSLTQTRKLLMEQSNGPGLRVFSGDRKLA